jgi:excisionase family DNA binding protein
MSLLTPADVARWAAVSERTVRRAIARGDLRVGRVGSQLRIAPNDARAWVFGERDDIVLCFPVNDGVTLDDTTPMKEARGDC